MNIKKRFLYIIVIFASAAAITVVFTSGRKHDLRLPEVKITQGADDDIDVTVTRPQIRNDIARIAIDEFLSQTEIVPSEKGLKLAEFKDDSMLAKYGFRRGDIVQAIDGRQVRSIEDALEVCGALERELLGKKSEKRLTLALNRDGKALNVNFNIPEFVPEKVTYVMRLEKRGSK